VIFTYIDVANGESNSKL